LSQFFDIVQDIFLFFNKPAPRWASLGLGNYTAKIVLKKLCIISWEAKHNVIYALKIKFIAVHKPLTNMSLFSNKSDEKLMATGLKKKKKVESFEFILLLTIKENISRNYYIFSKNCKVFYCCTVAFSYNIIFSRTETNTIQYRIRAILS
jgi:hypothetical protein